MSEAVLEKETKKGTLKAVFRPDRGMNLVSYTLNGVEVIDTSTKNLFEERAAGLGALIGPHFHHRKYPHQVDAEKLFPHIKALKARGQEEYFSHGIARYVPWETKTSKEVIEARLSGKTEFQGVPISSLEGQNFEMGYTASLTEKGLSIKLSVVSETDSLVGLHYYYRLPNGKGRVKTQVAPTFRKTHDVSEPLPQKWVESDEYQIAIDLSEEETDFGFSPYPSPLGGKILLETSDYCLTTEYHCCSAENSFQVFHPKGASFVCIEPLSSSNPKKPQLTVSSLDILLSVDLPKGN